ncbi:hypothetical protein [Pseudomonas sp. JV245A]|uniref:hypothetical protein n=1 Tax=Pseudomonas sp. JV245A TaxID=1890668 RepID=UPI0028E0F7CB|nr:hypothetical protein [Pseudomonas sp. JV245A]MDT9643590.1 hypothetical protein [Pseudomonas sp. JV245A]
MTTNQTIDGVPRELLERVAAQADCMLGFSSSSNYDECLRVVDELRALLAKPAKPAKSECPHCLGDSMFGCAECEPDDLGQHQGEPVYQVSDGVSGWQDVELLRYTACSLQPEEYEVRVLYTRPAEQPAPTVPDGYCIMPKKLTAENGAKALLLGEFKLQSTHECPECRELEEPSEGCEICDGEGEYGQKHTIPWDQIKFIYSKVVKGLAVKAEPAKSRQEYICTPPAKT